MSFLWPVGHKGSHPFSEKIQYQQFDLSEQKKKQFDLDRTKKHFDLDRAFKRYLVVLNYASCLFFMSFFFYWKFGILWNYKETQYVYSYKNDQIALTFLGFIPQKNLHANRTLNTRAPTSLSLSLSHHQPSAAATAPEPPCRTYFFFCEILMHRSYNPMRTWNHLIELSNYSSLYFEVVTIMASPPKKSFLVVLLSDFGQLYFWVWICY